MTRTPPKPEKEADNLTSFPPVTEKEAEDIREMQRLNDARIYAK